MDERNAEKPMEYKPEKPVEVNVSMREKTLDEYVDELPRVHRARMELSMLCGLQHAAVASLSNVKRTERIAVASRVLASFARGRVPIEKALEEAVGASVKAADALLARIDEPEAGR